MMIDLELLEHLASTATGKGWANGWAGTTPADGPTIGDWKWPYRVVKLELEDAAFVSACDPETVVALVRAVRAARHYRDTHIMTRYGRNQRVDAGLRMFSALAPFATPSDASGTVARRRTG